MIELRFREDLYAGEAVDAAVKLYAAWARFETEQTDGAWVVRLEPTGDVEGATLADELANYALGATIERRRTGSA